MKVEEHHVDASVLQSLLGLTDRPGLDNGVALQLQVDSAKEP
jgi:hypothetical protein